ncbi:MAG: NUDIX hydrolase [Planctomycetes bacterium]|nr:NUDIX hydrolase [Planctomycetota bacterium]
MPDGSTLEPWPEEARQRLARFRVFDVQIARRRSPRTGRSHEFFVVDTLDWVNVLAFTRAGDLIAVRQYRHGSRSFTLEIPGGAIDPGEDPADAAAREVREETGYASDRPPVHLGAVSPNPALFGNRCHTYLIEGCELVGDLQQDHGEDIEVVTLPLPAFEDLVRTGAVDHALVLDALYLLRLHRGA